MVLTHNELVEIIENQTGEKPKQKDIAEALGADVGKINKRAIRNSTYDLDELNQINDWYEKKYFEFNIFDSAKINQMIKNVSSKKAQNEFAADYYPNVFGSCGTGTFILSEEKETISIPKRIISSYSPLNKYSVINAVGESMLPTIHNRDKLIVEHTQGQNIRDNNVYVFCYDNQVYVKRLIKNIDQLIIRSDNPDPIYVPKIVERYDMNNVQIIGRIVGIIRELD